MSANQIVVVFVVGKMDLNVCMWRCMGEISASHLEVMYADPGMDGLTVSADQGWCVVKVGSVRWVQ